MKKRINKTAWKKIKKGYKRVMQNVFLGEEDGSVFVMQHYRLKGDKAEPEMDRERLNPETRKGCESLNTTNK